MSEPKPTGRWTGLTALLCLLAVAGLYFGTPASEQMRPPLLDWNYVQEVQNLLGTGRIAEASAALDAGTLLNPDSIALMRGLPQISFFDREIARDLALRKRIANGYSDALQGGAHLDNSQRAMLDPATENAEMLTLLAPNDARSWFSLGFVYLRRGDDSKAPIDYMKAASNLKRAVSIDPDLPGATSTLRLATARAKRR